MFHLNLLYLILLVLYYSSLHEYFLLEDFTDYAEKQAYISALYQDKPSWQAKVIKNIANSGRFSSDDTIEGYAKDIWGII